MKVLGLAFVVLGLTVSEPADQAAGDGFEFTLSEPGYEAIAIIDPQIAADSRIFDAMQGQARAILPVGRTINEGNVERFQVDWTLMSSTPELMSILQIRFIYQGRAHGETGYSAELWDRRDSQQIAFESIFDPEHLEQAIAAINAAIAVDLERQKLARGIVDGVVERVRLSERLPSSPTLALSSDPGLLGGLTFWSGSYGLGAYVEGPYALTVPQSVFREFLREPYRAWFGGEPMANSGPHNRLVCGSVALVGCEQTQ